MSSQSLPCVPARSFFRPLRALHCLLRNFTHATRALTDVAGRWQAGIGEAPSILLDENQARAPPDVIVYASPASWHCLAAITPSAARARRQPRCRRSGGYGACPFDSHRYPQVYGEYGSSSGMQLGGNGDCGSRRLRRRPQRCASAERAAARGGAKWPLERAVPVGGDAAGGRRVRRRTCGRRGRTAPARLRASLLVRASGMHVTLHCCGRQTRAQARRPRRQPRSPMYRCGSVTVRSHRVAAGGAPGCLLVR